MQLAVPTGAIAIGPCPIQPFREVFPLLPETWTEYVNPADSPALPGHAPR